MARPRDLEIEEYKQIWAHHRHLENQRNLIFNVFITVSGALLAFLAQLSSNEVGSRTSLSQTSYFIVVLLSVMTFLFYAQMRRMTEVIHAYDDQIIAGKNHFFDPYPFLSIYHQHASQSWFANLMSVFGLRSLDKSMRSILLVILAVAVLLQLQMFIDALGNGFDGRDTFALAVSAVPPILLVLVILDFVFPGKQAQAYKNEKGG